MDHPHLLVPRLWLKQLKYFFCGIYNTLFSVIFTYFKIVYHNYSMPSPPFAVSGSSM